MNRSCAWCKMELPAEAVTDHVVTNDVCSECRDRFSSPAELISLEQYLERLSAPVLLMDDDVRVLGYNTAARMLLGKNPPDILGHYGGEVIECSYAHLPGGCGRTAHCKACTIRRTVTNTHLTGTSHSRETACQPIQKVYGQCETRFKISTEKVGLFVLLRIDEVQSS